jgi:hypothetical protein
VDAYLNFSTLNLAKKSERQISSVRQLLIARRRDLEEAHPRDHLSCGYQAIVERRGIALPVHEHQPVSTQVLKLFVSYYSRSINPSCSTICR